MGIEKRENTECLGGDQLCKDCIIVIPPETLIQTRQKPETKQCRFCEEIDCTNCGIA